MKNAAQVVVIGGGIVGCSVAYHLAKYGWTDVVIVERQELTSGSSWHAAGGLFTITRPYAAARIHKYTFDIYRELEKESGQSCGFHFTGGLNLCRTQQEIESNLLMQSACRRMGIESYELDLTETSSKAPILDTTNILSAFWEEEGGHVDPASATQAFAAAARKLGVEVQRHNPVLETSQLEDDSWLVNTKNGQIKCEFIVNAAGLWGREVAKLAGIELPLVPVEHHYLVTDKISQISQLDFELPQINDNEVGCYARQEGLGLLLGAYERSCTHWSVEETPENFGHELLPNDISRMDWNFEKAVEVMPCLTEAGIKKIINGPMIFSPDLGPLLGPHPKLKNYFCANGVMAGFNQGAGVGKAISEWIIQGEPEFDIFCWDVARFGDWASKGYAIETTRYFYENRSEKVYPYQEFEAGRPVYKPPVYEKLKAAGGVFGASFGLEHPNWFSPENIGSKDTLTYRQPNWWRPVIDEGKRVRNEVGLMEYSAMAKYEISGPGAQSWLNHLMANRMPKRGKTVLTPMLSQHGRLVGDFSIAHIDENRYFVFGTDYMQFAHLRHFRHYLPHQGVTVTNLSQNYCGLHICGPNAQELISRIAACDMDTLSFPFLHTQGITVAGIDNVVTLRISYTGETGYEMYLPAEHQMELFDCLMDEGRKLGIGLVGSRCLMQTRLEKSFPAWGFELSPDYTVTEAEVSRFVDMSKEDFVGKSAISASVIPREKFVTLTLEDGDYAVWGDEAIFLDNSVVGYVTSGGFGPQTQRHIALGYMDCNAADEEGNLTVEILGQLKAAQICEHPVYDPSGDRMRA